MKLLPLTLPGTVTTMLISLLAGALVATAADAPPPGRGGPPERGDRGDRGDRGFRLDDKQRALLREGFEGQREALQKLDEQMRAAQKELLTVVLSAQPDEAAVRAKGEAVAKIQVEQTLVRARIIAKVVPSLTPEQRGELENSPFAMMLLSTGGMRGGDVRGGDPRGGDPRARGERPAGQRPAR